jgi:hypothetical protein
MAAAMDDKGHDGAAWNGTLGQRKANSHRPCGLVKGHEHDPSPIGGTIAAAGLEQRPANRRPAVAYVFWSM